MEKTAKNKKLVDNLPNYTPVSNLFLDNIQQFSSSEKNIFLFITRKISGWHKQAQTCSISYIMNGTGLSRQSVITGTRKLLKNKWIKRVRIVGNNGYTFEYSLSSKVFISDTSSLKFRPVKNLDQSKNLTSTSLKFRLNTVKNLDTIKETIKRNKFKKTREANKHANFKNEKGELNSIQLEQLNLIIKKFSFLSEKDLRITESLKQSYLLLIEEFPYNEKDWDNAIEKFNSELWRVTKGYNSFRKLLEVKNFEKYSKMNDEQLKLENNTENIKTGLWPKIKRIKSFYESLQNPIQSQGENINPQEKVKNYESLQNPIQSQGENINSQEKVKNYESNIPGSKELSEKFRMK